MYMYLPKEEFIWEWTFNEEKVKSKCRRKYQKINAGTSQV